MKPMKKLLALLLALALICGLLPGAFAAGPAAPAEPNAGDVAVNETNFPDAEFREYVKQFDTSSNGLLNEAELAAVTDMGCSEKSIADLTGVEYFTALRSLSCYGNQLTSLDLSQNVALTRLSLSGNQLTSLDVSKNTALTYLTCFGNQLTSLDLSAVPALKDAVENGDKDTSDSRFDKYSSSQGRLYVDKTVTIKTQPDSGLWVQGVPVTEENRNDILGDGKVRYEPESHTLTLDDRPLTDGSWTAGEGWAVYAFGMNLTICDTTGTVRLNAADASAALAKGIWSDGSVSIQYDLCSENAVALVQAYSVNVRGDCVECDLEAESSVYTGNFTRVREDGRTDAAAIRGQDITIYGDAHIETASGDCIQGGVQNDSDALGSVTVQGDLYLRASAGLGGDGWGIFTYGDITVGGNVDAECAAAVLEASFGDVRVDGDFRAVTGEGPQPVGNVGDEFRSAAGGGPDPEKYLFPFANGTPIIAIRGSVFLWGSVDIVTEACVGVFAGNELWPCGRSIDVEATEAAFLAGKKISGPASSVLDLPVNGLVQDCTINGNTFRTFTEADEVTVAPHVILHDSIYPLWVGGVQVSEMNQDDILGDGLASFDPKTNTLTLKETSLSGIYSWRVTEWGTTYDYSAVIYAGEKMGDLTVNAPNGLSLDNVDRLAKSCGIFAAGGNLSINGNLTAQLSDAAIYTENGDAVLNGSLDVSSTGQAIYVYGGFRLNGTLRVESEGSTAVYVRDDFTVTGNAEINAGNGRGIFLGLGNLTALADFACYASHGVEIQNGDFRVDGSAVIVAESTEIALLAFGKVTVGAGAWDITGKRCAVAAAGGIELPFGNEITLPQGGRLSTVPMSFPEDIFIPEMTVVTEADGVTVAPHVILHDSSYLLRILGVEVTEANKDDILDNGVFTFEPATNTLTIHDNYGTVDLAAIIDNYGCDGLVIDPVQPSVFSNDLEYHDNFTGIPDTLAPGLKLSADTEITGAGLTMKWYAWQFDNGGPMKGPERSTVEVDARVQLTIRDTAFTDVSDPNKVVYSLQGAEGSKLVVDRSAVTLSCGVSGFTGGISLVNCEIVEPEGGYVKDGAIVDADGNPTDYVRIEPLENPFVDVQEGKYYYEPVLWAFYHNPQVTNGMDATHFGPDNACTRGQVVTFLWRAAGCPEPTSTKTGFTDVKPGAFYEKAVAWAVESQITNGMSPTSFAPNNTCTRGQIVTFLWRFKGKPEPAGGENPFADVTDGAFYYKAVLWAVEAKVTNGMSPTSFAPNSTCTRGQVVTFLYRATAE